jgi:hypothetical protein
VHGIKLLCSQMGNSKLASNQPLIETLSLTAKLLHGNSYYSLIRLATIRAIFNFLSNSSNIITELA